MLHGHDGFDWLATASTPAQPHPNRSLDARGSQARLNIVGFNLSQAQGGGGRGQMCLQ